MISFKGKIVTIAMASFTIGAVVGATVVYFRDKKKSGSNLEAVKEQPEQSSEEEVKVDKVEKAREIVSYNDVISDLQYRDQHDEDMTADPLTEAEQEILDDYLINQEHKAFKERNWGKIEEISREDFENFLYQTGGRFEDWEGEDLYFFQDEQSVTDSIGTLLTAEKVAQNLGDTLDISNFRKDSREHLYVACYDVETIFDIKKVVSQTRDEFFE